MDAKSAQKIVDRLNKDTGYTKEFRNTVIEMLSQLQFDYDFETIYKNMSILPVADRLRVRYRHIPSIVCTWRDVGPIPYDGDFMAACLNDYNDIFVVFLHPTDESKNIGVHIAQSIDKTVFELREVSLDENNYISEEELILELNNLISDLGLGYDD